MSFADNLIELRKYHDFSQEELAERIGVSRQIVIPAKARKIFEINPGDNLIVLGDEGQGIAIIKEKGLLGLLNNARKKRKCEKHDLFKRS